MLSSDSVSIPGYQDVRDPETILFLSKQLKGIEYSVLKETRSAHVLEALWIISFISVLDSMSVW